MISYPIIFLSIPIGFWIALDLVPVNEMNWEMRSLIHALGYSLSYLPFIIGIFFQKKKPQITAYIYLSANVLRLLGFLFLFGLTRIFYPNQSINSLIIYSVSIGSFLLFQIIATLKRKRMGS